jgi:hypothetical protein
LPVTIISSPSPDQLYVSGCAATTCIKSKGIFRDRFFIVYFFKVEEKCFSEDALNEKVYQAHNDVEVLSDTPHSWGRKSL